MISPRSDRQRITPPAEPRQAIGLPALVETLDGDDPAGVDRVVRTICS